MVARTLTWPSVSPAVDEVAAEGLQGGLVDGVDQVGDLNRQRIGNRQRLRLDVWGAVHVGGLDGAGRLEARVGCPGG